MLTFDSSSLYKTRPTDEEKNRFLILYGGWIWYFSVCLNINMRWNGFMSICTLGIKTIKVNIYIPSDWDCSTSCTECWEITWKRLNSIGVYTQNDMRAHNKTLDGHPVNHQKHTKNMCVSLESTYSVLLIVWVYGNKYCERKQIWQRKRDMPLHLVIRY